MQVLGVTGATDYPFLELQVLDESFPSLPYTVTGEIGFVSVYNLKVVDYKVDLPYIAEGEHR